jgi:hypothetical protein
VFVCLAYGPERGSWVGCRVQGRFGFWGGEAGRVSYMAGCGDDMCGWLEGLRTSMRHLGMHMTLSSPAFAAVLASCSLQRRALLVPSP